MNTFQTDAQPGILVMDPVAMVGGIIVSTARQLHLPTVTLATSMRTAQQLLDQQAFSGLVLSLDDEGPALALLQNLRSHRYVSNPGIPVAVTAASCGAEMAQTMRTLLVCRILLKPFKVRDVILTIQMLEGISA